MDLENLKSIGERMLTQDSRATQYPIFMIVEDKKVYGMSDEWSEGKERVDLDSSHVRNGLCESCSDLHENDQDLPDECDNCSSDCFVNYKIEQDVPNLQAGFFLTEEACHAHIRANKHHYSNPKSYVICAWRNPEMVAVMQHLVELTGKEVPSHYR